MKKLLFWLLLMAPFMAYGQQRLTDENWIVEFDSLGITKIVSVKDKYQANLLSDRIGQVLLSYKVENGVWLTVPSDKRSCSFEESTGVLTYTDQTIGGTLTLVQNFYLKEERLQWDIEIENHCPMHVSIGDLAIAVPWNGNGGEEPEEIFERTFTKHAFISGDASFMYFTRFSGEAPYIMLLPDRGTPLEYYDSQRRQYLAYIHSGKTGGREMRGTWRQPHTFGHLAPAEITSLIESSSAESSLPAGSIVPQSSKLQFGFSFLAADSYQTMRNALYDSHSIDTKVVPGMTLPRGQVARFALRTRCSIDSIVAEFPGKTHISFVGKRDESYLYDVEFEKLGENKLTLYFDEGRKSYLEFFSCESPETLMKKRSSFLVHHQQFRDSTKWYNGLYGVYDMKNGELRGPDNPDFYDERLTYFLASDDPILGKAPFIASKNVVFPDDEEIASLEYHLEHFVWGGLQRTDNETPYQYGVYGTPNWYINRHPELRKTLSEYRLDREHVWRTYDYPHVMMLYWEMYKIAKKYPEKSRYLDAAGYLERAYQTTKAYFSYPTELLGDYYETFKWGAYNELIISDMIDELEACGLKAQADTVRNEWEKKVKYFIYDDKYPYRSEYAADRTAFESTYALAKYGMLNKMAPDQNSWYDKNRGVWYSHPKVSVEDVRDFMQRQLYANLACRGVLENQWFMLGSDFFGSADWSLDSYMARMGGWGILDYALTFAREPFDWLRLGYSSYLGQYGLVNSGDRESDYGFWYPGKERDGAMGQAFTPTKAGGAWIGTQDGRGPWRYCGEGDLGMCAITRTAATVLADDPLFGRTLYGGRLSEDNSGFSFIPDDGVRTRLFVVSSEDRLGIELDRDNWSSSEPVRVEKKGTSGFGRISFVIENATGTSHVTSVTVSTFGGKSRKPALYANGKKIRGKLDRYGRLVFSVAFAPEVSAISCEVR